MVNLNEEERKKSIKVLDEKSLNLRKQSFDMEVASNPAEQRYNVKNTFIDMRRSSAVGQEYYVDERVQDFFAEEGPVFPSPRRRSRSDITNLRSPSEADCEDFMSICSGGKDGKARDSCNFETLMEEEEEICGDAEFCLKGLEDDDLGENQKNKEKMQLVITKVTPPRGRSRTRQPEVKINNGKFRDLSGQRRVTEQNQDHDDHMIHIDHENNSTASPQTDQETNNSTNNNLMMYYSAVDTDHNDHLHSNNVSLVVQTSPVSNSNLYSPVIVTNMKKKKLLSVEEYAKFLDELKMRKKAGQHLGNFEGYSIPGLDESSIEEPKKSSSPERSTSSSMVHHTKSGDNNNHDALALSSSSSSSSSAAQPSTSTETRTTMMLRNIPNKYTQAMLLKALADKGFRSRFDFFYLPIDFKNRCNVGYAFVNFVTPHDAVLFLERFHGHKLKAYNSPKVCEVNYARVQGLEANVEVYRNSPINGIGIKQYQPLVFKDGESIAFPAPDAPLPPIQLREDEQQMLLQSSTNNNTITSSADPNNNNNKKNKNGKSNNNNKEKQPQNNKKNKVTNKKVDNSNKKADDNPVYKVVSQSSRYHATPTLNDKENNNGKTTTSSFFDHSSSSRTMLGSSSSSSSAPRGYGPAQHSNNKGKNNNIHNKSKESGKQEKKTFPDSHHMRVFGGNSHHQNTNNNAQSTHSFVQDQHHTNSIPPACNREVENMNKQQVSFPASAHQQNINNYYHGFAGMYAAGAPNGMYNPASPQLFAESPPSQVLPHHYTTALHQSPKTFGKNFFR